MIKRTRLSHAHAAVRHGTVAFVVFCLVWLAPPTAHAQESAQRDATWGTVTLVTAISAASVELLMPRVADSLPERTLGWKARWHATVLLPAVVSGGLAAVNELWLRP